MGRQCTVVASRAIAAWRCLGRVRRSGILSRLVLAHGLLEVLEPELQLVRAQLLRPAAELMSAQALDQHLL